jgi:hypothetical protein
MFRTNKNTKALSNQSTTLCSDNVIEQISTSPITPPFTALNDALLPVENTDKKTIEYYLFLTATCAFNVLPKHGLAFAQFIARQVPAQFSLEQAVNIVTTALLERGYDPKLMPRRVIYNNVKRRREQVKKLNTLYSRLGLEPHLMPDWSNEQIAAKIKEVANGIWIDNRGLGQGKTKLLEVLRKTLRNCGIAYITHRVSLVKDACTRLDISDYQDNEIGISHLGLCVNSIKKYNIDTLFNVLFLDEARQIVEHVIRGTVDNRSGVFTALTAAISSADLIIASDADMNDETVEFLKTHANGKKLHLIVTEPKDNTKTIKLLKDFKASFASILNLLIANENLFIACTSRTKAIELHTFLLENGISSDKLLLVHSENKGLIEQAEFLSSPNVHATKYQAVIHSPTLGSGFSVEVPHFTTNFMLDSGNLPANECLQMTARNRCADIVFYAFAPQTNYNRPTDLDLLHEGEGHKVQHFMELHGKAYVPSELGYRRIKNAAQINEDLNDHRNSTLLLADIKGMTIDYSLMHESISDEMQLKLDGLTVRVKEQRAESIVTANQPTPKHASELSKKPARTQKESDELNRYQTTQMAGSENISLEDAVNFLNHAMVTVQNVELMASNIEDLKAQDRANHVTEDKAQSKVSLYKIFHELLALVLSVDRIDKDVALEFCDILKRHAAELAANGFSDYRKESKNPMKTLGNFLKKMGWKLRVHKRNGYRTYSVEKIDYIERYVANRKILKDLSQGVNNTFFLNKTTVRALND